MLKKIGFSGSHSVGKTTLMYSVAGALQGSGLNIGLVNETAREVKFDINDRTSFFAQTDIFALQLHRELALHARKVDVILTDRTALDAVAYSYFAEEEGRIEEGWADAMLPLALKWLNSYDLVFYIKPFEGGVVADEERWVDNAAQKRVDEILWDLYKKNFCPKSVRLIDNSLALSERKDYVVKEVTALLQ